jgi:uncharacterized protein (DUF433 family)
LFLKKIFIDKKDFVVYKPNGGDKMKSLLHRIEINPEVLHGKPVIRKTRIPVSLILNLLRNGYTFNAITSAYPDISTKDILAAIELAAKFTEYEEVELKTTVRRKPLSTHTEVSV